jgi:hypothetical protein
VPRPAAPPPPGDFTALAELWPAVVDAIRPEQPMLAALVEGARPVGLEGEELVVAFAPDAAFLKRKAEAEEPRRAVTAALRSVAGRPLAVRYELREPPAGDSTGPDGVDADEWVRRFMAEFDAEEI